MLKMLKREQQKQKTITMLDSCVKLRFVALGLIPQKSLKKRANKNRKKKINNNNIKYT